MKKLCQVWERESLEYGTTLGYLLGVYVTEYTQTSRCDTYTRCRSCDILKQIAAEPSTHCCNSMMEWST